MFRLFVVSLVLVSASFVNPADVDKSDLVDNVYNTVQSAKIGEMSIAENLSDLRQTTWHDTLKCLVPDLKGARDGLTKLSNTLTNFVNTLQRQKRSPSWNTVYIPDRYFRKIVDSATAVKQSIVNILFSKLIRSLEENSGILDSYQGWVVVPRSFAAQIRQILSYMSQQFEMSRAATLELQKGLNDLARIPQPNNDAYVPYLFRKAAKLAGENADHLGDIATDFANLINSYAQVTQADSNGNLLIPARQLKDITGTFGTDLANSYYDIADSLQAFLDNITSSSQESS